MGIPPAWRPPLSKTNTVLMVALSAFALGGYSVEFSGRTLAWVALVGWLVVLGLSLGSLISGFWRAESGKS